MNNYYLGFATDPKAFIVMVLSLSYLIFGMILISMCLNLMQEQIIEKVRIKSNTEISEIFVFNLQVAHTHIE